MLKLPYNHHVPTYWVVCANLFLLSSPFLSLFFFSHFVLLTKWPNNSKRLEKFEFYVTWTKPPKHSKCMVKKNNFKKHPLSLLINKPLKRWNLVLNIFSSWLSKSACCPYVGPNKQKLYGAQGTEMFAIEDTSIKMCSNMPRLPYLLLYRLASMIGQPQMFRYCG